MLNGGNNDVVLITTYVKETFRNFIGGCLINETRSANFLSRI